MKNYRRGRGWRTSAGMARHPKVHGFGISHLAFPEHVRRSLRPPPGSPRRRPLTRQADRGRRQQGDAPGAPGAARGRRQLQGRQAVHRGGQGARARARRARLAQPRPAGGEDRLRRADDADGRGGARPRTRQARADRDPDGRPAGLGQDHRLRQARAPPARGAQDGRGGGGLRRLPARRGRPAGQGRRPGRRPRVRAGHGPRPGRHRRVGARPGQARPPRRPDRRHERPPARRRGAHAGARRDQEAHQAAQRAAGGRRDDRPGRGQRG